MSGPLQLVPGQPEAWPPLRVGVIPNPGLALLGAEPVGALLARGRAAPPFTWLWEPYVPASGSVMVVAPPGTGKTWFALRSAVMAGFIGRTTLLVEEEGSVRGLGARLEGLAVKESMPIHTLHRQGVRIDDGETLRRLLLVVQCAPDPVVICDPLVTLFTGDENSTEDAAELIRLLGLLYASNPRLLLMVLHHSSKVASGPGAGPPVYASRGSSVLAGWFDTVINLAPPKTEEGAEEVPGVVEFSVQVAKLREAQAPRGWSEVKIVLGEGAVTQAPRSKSVARGRMEDVLFALADGPLSGNQIQKAIGGNRMVVKQATKDLLSNGLIRRRPDLLFEVEVKP